MEESGTWSLFNKFWFSFRKLHSFTGGLQPNCSRSVLNPSEICKHQGKRADLSAATAAGCRVSGNSPHRYISTTDS